MIVDDEPLAIEAMENLVGKVKELCLVKTCHDAVDAFQYLQKQKVDLVFLDIEMPELSGIDFLKTLQNPPQIIFTTAYRQYAADAFDMDVLDYLVKPISFERFLRAVNRYFEKNTPSLSSIAEHNHNESIVIRADKKNIKVNLNEIILVSSLKDYVKLKTINKTYITKLTISKMEELLPEEKFTRIHRSYIVAINKIKSFTSTSVEIEGEYIPISRNYRQNVLEKLKS